MDRAAQAALFAPEPRPISVLRGEDPDALATLIPIHWRGEDPRILDVTYNRGVMWKGLPWQPHRMDINGDLGHVETVGDFMALPFDAASFDIIVFDPPHLPTAAASENSSGLHRDAYGITDSGEGREGKDISPMFAPFLREAQRVLVEHGIVLAKIADITHDRRYRWQHVDFIIAAREAGMTPCDLLVKWPKAGGLLQSSKWKTVYHLRKAHSYWIVVRNSDQCMAPGCAA